MTDFVVTIHIKARPEVVWSVLANVCQWPDWTPTVERVISSGNGPLGLGSKIWIKQPRLRAAVWTISVWEPNVKFTWISRNPGISITADHTLSPLPDGTQVTLHISFQGLLSFLMGPLVGNLTKRYLHQESVGLKQASEQAQVIIPIE